MGEVHISLEILGDIWMIQNSWPKNVVVVYCLCSDSLSKLRILKGNTGCSIWSDFQRFRGKSRITYEHLKELFPIFSLLQSAVQLQLINLQ